FDVLVEILGRFRRWQGKQSIVGLKTSDNRHVASTTLGVHYIWWFRQKPSIEDGTCALHVQQVCRWNRAQVFQVRTVMICGEFHAILFSSVQVFNGQAGDTQAAIGHGALEKSFRLGRSEQSSDAKRSGGLSPERNAVRVASERRDVLLHPRECGDLIEKPVIAG